MSESDVLTAELRALGRTMIIEPPPEDLVERVLARLPADAARSPLTRSLAAGPAPAAGRADHRRGDHRSRPDPSGAGRGGRVAADRRGDDPDRPAPTRARPHGRPAADGRAPWSLWPRPRRWCRSRSAYRQALGPPGPDRGLRRPAGGLDGLDRPMAIRSTSTSSTARCPGSSSRQAPAPFDVRRRGRPGRDLVPQPARGRPISTATGVERTEQARIAGPCLVWERPAGRPWSPCDWRVTSAGPGDRDRRIDPLAALRCAPLGRSHLEMAKTLQRPRRARLPSRDGKRTILDATKG